MLNITHIASGSSGNCYLVDDGKTSLLLEAGVNMMKLRKGVGFMVSAISGCLISHEHGDHAKSVRDAMKSGVPIYMSAGTFTALHDGVGHFDAAIVEHGDPFKIGSFDIMPFNVEHDAAEPLGFLIKSGFHKLLYATDTAFLRYRFPGLTHVMIECNYVPEVLDENVRNGSVHPAQKKRVLFTHFGLDNVIEFLKDTDCARIVEVHLLHLSAGNSDENVIRSKIERFFALREGAHHNVKVVIP
jgi:phosphoribosyl 1,2-cyclic phosphodiesterase